MTTQFKRYRPVLEAHAREFSRLLRDRGQIAIEAAPEDTEKIALAGLRDLAVESIHRKTELLREVQSALARLSQGTFGCCEECDRDIPQKRLDALPWARRCVSCQERHDSEHRFESRTFRLAA